MASLCGRWRTEFGDPAQHAFAPPLPSLVIPPSTPVLPVPTEAGDPAQHAFAAGAPGPALCVYLHPLIGVFYLFGTRPHLLAQKAQGRVLERQNLTHHSVRDVLVQRREGAIAVRETEPRPRRREGVALLLS